MPKKIEFEIPQPIGYEKVGSLDIPLYGFVFQSEEETFEWAMNDYFQEVKEKGLIPHGLLKKSLKKSLGILPVNCSKSCQTRGLTKQ
jgi:hypothetical protein